MWKDDLHLCSTLLGQLVASLEWKAGFVGFSVADGQVTMVHLRMILILLHTSVGKSTPPLQLI
jgi:hypothetical protein